MLLLTKLHLENFCSYEHYTFDFRKPDGNPYRYICFFGPNGIGKCVVSSCYINTYEKGMIQIGELFSDKTLSPDTWYDADFSIECNGELCKVNKIYYNGKKSTTRIKTKCGFSIEGSTDKHKILGVRDGEIKFIKIKDLNLSDFVCISRKSHFHDLDSIAIARAKILGYLISEGHCSSKSCVFYNSDEEILSDFVNAFAEEFHIELKTKQRRGNNKSIHVPVEYKNQLVATGLTLKKSGDKTVPISVLSGSKEVIVSFLQAYFEGDGGVERSIESVTCTSKSYTLMHQIHLLLLRLGIVSVLSMKYTKKLSCVDKPYELWRIFIQGEDVIKYEREIGFVSTRKKEELDNLLLRLELSHRNPNKDIIPSSLIPAWSSETQAAMKEKNVVFCRDEHKDTANGLHCLQPNYLKQVKLGISRDKIQQCISTINRQIVAQSSNISVLPKPPWLKDRYFFDQVESTEHGEEDLFDICVDDKHSFWSNGFTSHNSTLLEAISLLTMNQIGRDPEYIKRSLRKYVRNPDYDPSYEKISGHTYKEDFITSHQDNLPEMIIEGTYDLDGTPYVVRMNQDGFVRNDLAPEGNGPGPWGDDHLFYRQRVAHFITSDSDLSMSKFQLRKEQSKAFEELTSAIMRYPTECVAPSGIVPIDRDYSTDFVIHKGQHKIHYKRMSAGERKIAKSFSQLLNLVYELGHPDPGEPVMEGWPRLLLLDNVEMHIYYDRHIDMVECMKRHFHQHQIFATTHSGVLIERFRRGEHVENELMIDLEPIN